MDGSSSETVKPSLPTPAKLHAEYRFKNEEAELAAQTFEQWCGVHTRGDHCPLPGTDASYVVTDVVQRDNPFEGKIVSVTMTRVEQT